MRHRQVLILLLLAGLNFALPSISTAGDWNRTSTAIFDRPVQIPGQVLPAGIYVFKLADISGDRNVVQIWNADETALIATVMGWPEYLRNSPAKNTFVLEGRENGAPVMLKAWYYEGNSGGETFIYSNPHRRKQAR